MKCLKTSKSLISQNDQALDVNECDFDIEIEIMFLTSFNASDSMVPCF